MRCPGAAWLLAAWAATLAAPVAAAADGAALYNQHCATCHQATGAGTVGLAPSLLGPHWQRLGAERSYLPTVLLKGLAGAIQVNGAMFVGSMPAMAGTLDDAALAAVANHLRTLQGAAGEAPYSADDFSALRSAAGNPGQTRALRRKILGD